MALSNKSFETAGVDPGWAANWTISISADADLVANFHLLNDYPTSTERFSPGWGNDEYATSIVGGSPASFDSGLAQTLPQFEAFNRWISSSNKKYQTEIGGGIAAIYVGASGTFTTDGFEVDWSNTPYLSSMPNGSSFLDNLNSGWGNNSYVTTISGGTNATFDSGATYEDFDPIKGDVPFVISPSSPNTLTATAHGLTSNQKVTVISTGVYPTGLAKNVVYHVIGVDANNIRLSAVSGPGAAVTISDSGTGDLSLHMDPKDFWTAVD